MELGPTEISLSEPDLAKIGRATAYEAQAKTFLSLSLKRLMDIDHNEWLTLERMQFSQIVQKISDNVSDRPNLKSKFETIAANHERWRDARNLVVHAIWGTGPDGGPATYCFRRQIRADENDIVRALNDCFWLAKKAREFAHEVAITVLDGQLPKCKDGEGFVHVKLANDSVTY